MTDTTNRPKSDRPQPDKIEQEVRRTQDDIGRTVDRLEEKLSPEEVSRSLIGDDGTEMAEEALEVARTNPIPIALIAVGIIWLIASSRSGPMRRLVDRIAGNNLTSGDGDGDLRPRSAEPAPIGPPPPAGEGFDRRRQEPSG